MKKNGFIVALIPSLICGGLFGMIMFRTSGASLGVNIGVTLGVICVWMVIFLLLIQGSSNRQAQAVHKMHNITDLIAILQNQRGAVRATAATALGKLRDTQATEPLIAALQDKDSSVRTAVVEALGELGDHQAVEPLINALQDENVQVRLATVKALGNLRNTRAVEPLIAVLHDKDFTVQSAAVTILGNMGDTRAVEPLITVFNGHWDLALQALDKLGDPRAAESLIVALQSNKDSKMRAMIATVLGKLGTPKAVEPLITALQDKDNNVRIAAISALGKLGGTHATEALITTLQDKDGQLRIVAATALIKLDPPSAIWPLIVAALQAPCALCDAPSPQHQFEHTITVQSQRWKGRKGTITTTSTTFKGIPICDRCKQRKSLYGWILGVASVIAILVCGSGYLGWFFLDNRLTGFIFLTWIVVGAFTIQTVMPDNKVKVWWEKYGQSANERLQLTQALISKNQQPSGLSSLETSQKSSTSVLASLPTEQVELPRSENLSSITTIQKWEDFLKQLPIVDVTPSGNMNTTRYNDPQKIAEHLAKLEMTGISPVVRSNHVYVLQKSDRTVTYENYCYRTDKREWVHVLDVFYSD